MPRNEKAKLIFKLLILMIFFSGAGRSQKLFLVAGQSNASGTGDFLSSQQCNPLTAFEYRESINGIIPLADPVGENDHGFDAANTGSAWPTFAKRYHELSSQQVYIVQAAKSASSLNPSHLEHLRWDSLGNLWQRCIQKTQKAVSLTNVPLSGIIWAQGEADASFINSKRFTKDRYFIELKKLILRFRNTFGPAVPFYIIQTGFAAGENSYGYEEVQKAQEEICKDLPFTYVVYTFTKYFPEFGLMKDYIHYNQQGYNVLGKSVADVIHEVELSGSHNPPASFDSVFPNPSNSVFQFQFRNVALEEQITVQIFDTQSNLVKQLSIGLNAEPVENISFDLNGLPNGIFLLRHRQKVHRIKVMH